MEHICYYCKYCYLSGVSFTDWRCAIKDDIKVSSSDSCDDFEEPEK